MANKIILSGNVGSVTYPETENQPLKMSLATTETYKDKKTGNKVEETDWHNLVVFGAKQKEIFAKFIGVGSTIVVVGKQKNRKTESEGKTYYNSEVWVDEIEFVSLKEPKENAA